MLVTLLAAKRPIAFFLLLSIVALHAQRAVAQGVLIDERRQVHFHLPRPIPHPRPTPQPAPEVSYAIESLEIDAKLEGAIARVQVSQTFVNTGSRQIEASFVFPLPYDGAIDQLTLLVNGKEYAAELLTKEEARERYERIVRSNKDPALLEWVGTGMFQTSVFPIPPGEKRTVTLRYSQVCRQSHGLTDFQFPLSTAKYTTKPLKKLKFRVVIDSPTDIKNIYSATHDVKIERSSAKQAVVNYEQADEIPSSDFRLFFDANESAVAGSVISYRPDKDGEGYFLLLASPKLPTDDEKPAPKTMVFVVDRSGSMSGEKIEQARGALKFVLNNLREGDLFNIVAYDSNVETFRPELEKFSEESRVAAEGFVNGLYAGGSTNIDAALSRTLGMLQDSERPSYVIFLTDGLPTVGEQSEAKIAANAEKANAVRARLFSFGVGYDVNSRLLDKLSSENHGQSEYVRPSENIEAAVSKLYRRIGTPVMTDAELAMEVEATGDVINRVYPKGKFDLFAGDQTVIVGRYRSPGAAKGTISGTLAGEAQSFDFAADLAELSEDDSNAFVAKLWATRRVGELIDELDLHGKNDELIKELVELATRHGILTPYTSFLADENSNVRDADRNLDLAQSRVSDLSSVTGEYATNQRGAKAMYKNAQAAPAASRGGGGGFGGVPMEAEEMARLQENAGRGTTYFDAKLGKQRVATTLFSLGRKTFFRRGEKWVDSSVSEEDEQSVIEIQRFSPEYFKLAEKFGKRVTPYLAIEDPVVVKIEGKTYAW